jgi:hypothetical protein
MEIDDPLTDTNARLTTVGEGEQVPEQPGATTEKRPCLATEVISAADIPPAF